MEVLSPSNYFLFKHFLTSKVFWCFQGDQKRTLRGKWLNRKFKGTFKSIKYWRSAYYCIWLNFLRTLGITFKLYFRTHSVFFFLKKNTKICNFAYIVHVKNGFTKSNMNSWNTKSTLIDCAGKNWIANYFDM